jgi:outer membrane protein assembly factor BamD (BamD/ComL family)
VLMSFSQSSCAAGRAPAQDLRSKAFRAFKAKDYVGAVNAFYQISRNAKTLPERQESKFYLGIALAKLNLMQVASFPLVDVVRTGPGKYQKRALNQLAVIAKNIDEKALLQFSVSKLQPGDLTDISKSAFYMNLSEISEFNQRPSEAANWAAKAFEADAKNEEAIYQLGSLALSKPDAESALKYFSILLERYGSKPVTDKKRGLVLMNIARTYYQMKNWPEAVSYYRQIPKDHFYYREAQRELSWALFRSGKFRSALSPLQSLTTPFYVQFYDPEMLLLSGIILVFSCQYDQAQVFADIYDKNYLPALGQLDVWSKSSHSDDDIYAELRNAQDALDRLNKTGNIESKGNLPFFILRTILAEADSQSRIRYMKKLDLEMKILDKNFAGSKVAEYGRKILRGRDKASKKHLAQLARNHLIRYRNETADINDQFGFLKYEILNGQRLKMRSEMAGEAAPSIADDKERSYYAQNGYRFWPMQGEFWRDEIGSYQYVGANLCKK